MTEIFSRMLFIEFRTPLDENETTYSGSAYLNCMSSPNSERISGTMRVMMSFDTL